MIQYEEALAIVESRALPLRMETVALSAAVGRVLAQDVVSDHDMPPFDKSAMDGFACRRADLACVLRVVETIPAGGVPQHEIGEGECARIMTGAMIPKGADCVFMIEQSEALPENVVRFTGSKTADNIAYQGEDIRCGQVVLNAGLRIEPRHIAVLAGAGCVEPRVARRLTVGVLATGSELVAPHEAVSGPQIRETNGAQLMAQLEQAGAVPNYYGIIEDERTAIETAIERAARENDVVLVSGGSSVGDFDFVPDLLAKNGRSILFETVAIKPGKPLVFACSDSAVCFGMPGNPVSTYIVMELFIKPFLLRSMGCTAGPRIVRQPLASAIRRKRAGRREYIPVAFTGDGRVERIAYHGSAHIHALSAADGWVVLPTDATELPEGLVVDVQLI